MLQGPSHAWRTATIGYKLGEEDEDVEAVYDFYEEEDKRNGQAIDRPPNATVVLDWFTSRPG